MYSCDLSDLDAPLDFLGFAIRIGDLLRCLAVQAVPACESSDGGVRRCARNMRGGCEGGVVFSGIGLKSLACFSYHTRCSYSLLAASALATDVVTSSVSDLFIFWVVVCGRGQ